jgi:hypothetical protein
MPAVSDAVWSAQGTTPDAIEAALREMLAERHAENGGFVPARALNMIAFVDREWSGEIANRLRGVGRFHASRLVVLSYEPHRERLDARASVASEGDPRPGELSLLRETVIVEIGDRHLDDLYTIADPLVVSDLPTLLWSPHGHHEIVEELLDLTQAVLLDSVAEPDGREAVARACEISERAYVVDLAWVRSIPWRERIATTFDPPHMRGELHEITSLTISHHPESAIAAMLLVGWLASRLGWQLVSRLQIEPRTIEDGTLFGPLPTTTPLSEIPLTRITRLIGGAMDAQRRPVSLSLRHATELQVPGLASLQIETAAGRTVRLDRGRGGLRAHRRDPDGHERTWTILGASRGEAGILGEGIRQALLRDPTYSPALRAAAELVPR